MMTNTGNNTAKYVGAAIAIGGTMLLGTGIIKDNKSVKKKLRKTAGKALDAFDGILTGMQNIAK